MYCIKTAEHIIKILSLSDRSIILVFRHQGSLHKSDGFIPNEGAKYKDGSNFRPICRYISERDTGIVTMEDEYKLIKSYVLYQIVSLSMTLNVSEPQFQCHSVKANISQTVHPIHSMSGSKQGFSGSADRMVLFPVR